MGWNRKDSRMAPDEPDTEPAFYQDACGEIHSGSYPSQNAV